MNDKSIAVGDYLSRQRKVAIDTVIELREACGLSQQELADLLGCSRSRIARIETGQNGEYSLGELELLALRFGQEPAFFLRSLTKDRSLLEQAYANAVTYPALGEAITCSLPAGVEAIAPSITDMSWMMLELDWSPDGDFLAGAIPAADQPEKHLLCVWDGQTGHLESVIPMNGYISALVFSLV